MDETYDVIVLGTGLKECIISGMCSVTGLKVLHMDRNSYYGGESASLNPLDQVYKHFRGEGDSQTKENEVNVNAKLKETRGKDWNIDLIPKFLMTDGDLVKLLISTGVTRYLEFKHITGSFVYKKGGKVYKIPANEQEALTSSLMGIFEKRRFKKMLENVEEYRKCGHCKEDIDPKKCDGDTFLNKFGVDENTKEITGHAIALYTDDSYKTDCAEILLKKITLYSESMGKFGGTSPYLFPLYGLGELPQGFARLSAIYGGTYMLCKKVDEIVYENDMVVGVKSGDEVAKCTKVVCDPSYIQDGCRETGQVVRAICILDEKPTVVKEMMKQDNYSFQLIFPKCQINRENDIFMIVVSNAHNVCPAGFYVAIISSKVETKDPQRELQIAIDMLPKPVETFYSVSKLMEPVPELEKKGIFVTKSYDPTSHFQTTCADVMDVIHKMEVDWEGYVKKREEKGEENHFESS